LFGFGFSSIVSLAYPMPASSATTPFTLRGAGAATMFRAINTIADDLGTASKPTDFRYATLGETEGKRAFAAGDLDFLVSGLPLTTQEESTVRGGVVKLPLGIASMAMQMSLPASGFDYYSLKDDPKCLPPNDPVNDPTGQLFGQCITFVKFPGDVDLGGAIPIPSTVLANMAMAEPQSPPTFVSASQPWYMPQPGDPAPGTSPSWSDPAVLAHWQELLNKHNKPTDPTKRIYSLIIAAAAKPWWIMRSEGSAENVYLQQFVKTVNPTLWDQMLGFWKQAPTAPVGDRVPQAVSRQGVEQQTALLGFPNSDFLNGAKGLDREGIVAAAPPSTLLYLKELFPTSDAFRSIAVENANGDYVVPTADSINKALVAGGQTANFAMTNKVAGAYPFVWVDYLYAPKTGLSIEATNSLAGYIRYFATTGQDVMANLGEGRLTDAMVAEALRGANTIVSSNCTGTDRHVVAAPDAGPYVPVLPATANVGPSLVCAITPPAPSPTTTAAPTTLAPTTAAPPAPTVAAAVLPSQVRPASIVSPTTSTSEAPTTAPTTVVTTVITSPPTTVKSAVKTPVVARPGTLPMQVPSTGGGGLDRFSTMALGSVGFLGLRRPVGRRLASLR
jgi:hypothetical protein